MTDFNETTSGNKIVSAFNLSDYQYDKFSKEIHDSFDVNMSLVKRVAWMSPIMYTIASIGIAFVMAFGTYLVLSGRMTSGSLLSFVTSLLLLYKPVKTLGNTLTSIQNIFVSLCRTLELFDIEPEIKDSDNAVVLTGVKEGVKLENVCFEYVKDTPVLKNINLEAKVGETVALVGNSGGGKSTIVNLLPRFYKIKHGAILIDDINIANYKINSLRNNISIVLQDNFLFAGTIRENILMGKQMATSEEIENAVKNAYLDSFIRTLDKGLDTYIGEKGVLLSGGQKQRIAIARAFIKNAPIVILDEATSALDNESEAIVQQAIDNLMKDKTVFVIAHRLSTIQNADRIAVINEGELVELGKHEELMQIENGKYKALFEMQFKKEEIA